MNLAAGIKELVKAKGISEELILGAVKDVLTQAYMKFKGSEEINVVQDLDKNQLDVYIVKKVVEQVEDPANEISTADAESILGESPEIGEKAELLTEPVKDFREKGIAWVSENIVQKITLIEKDAIKYEYENKRNRLTSGSIVKKDKQGNIFVDLGNTMGILPIELQSPIEHYEVEDTLRAVVVGIERGRRRGRMPGNRNVEIVLSRATPELVKELLAQEVPEVADGIVEIKRISREPGYKTKIAVDSDTIDAVSTCIGPHGVRVTNVVKELGGEKVDIVRYSENPREMIKYALTPAKVDRVIIEDEDSKAVFAVVEHDQLAYAFGRRKRNVVLAAKLCGWKINIKTESEVEEEEIEAADVRELKNVFGTPLSDLPNLSEELITVLNDNDIYLIEQLVDIEDLHKLENLSEDNIREIETILSENVEVEEIEPEEEGDEETEEEWEGTPLSVLPEFKEEWIKALEGHGISSIEDLVGMVQADTFTAIDELEESDIDAIKKVLSDNVEIEE